MHCHQCGTAVDDQDKFCSQCGETVRKATKASVASSSGEAQPPVVATRPSSGGRVYRCGNPECHGEYSEPTRVCTLCGAWVKSDPEPRGLDDSADAAATTKATRESNRRTADGAALAAAGVTFLAGFLTWFKIEPGHGLTDSMTGFGTSWVNILIVLSTLTGVVAGGSLMGKISDRPGLAKTYMSVGALGVFGFSVTAILKGAIGELYTNGLGDSTHYPFTPQAGFLLGLLGALCLTAAGFGLAAVEFDGIPPVLQRQFWRKW